MNNPCDEDNGVVFLWNPTSTSAINGEELTNYDFREALRKLAFTRQGKMLRPVDYKNLGADELGGVHESLLALTADRSSSTDWARQCGVLDEAAVL